ncbi:MAG TPA: alpha/beta hydrolase [Aggregatilineales bacterium]|nr:alpha/beta hydrolase [Aggregatilineales bacterium]
MTTHTINLSTNEQVDISVDEFGSGQPFVLLHGGAGAQSVTGYAQRLAASGNAHVFVPIHPGFGGTTRPDWLNSVRLLAQTYVALIEQLDLHDVTVVGSSIGGWIAAEMALCNSTRIGKLILVDAAGVEVEGQSVVDIFPLTLDEVMQRSYHNPAPFRPDPSTMTDAVKRIMAANRQALAVYGGQPSMADPTLLKRLEAISVPTLVLWGDSDRIVTPDYGRAYAAAIPGSRFQVLPKTGHLPQIETPDQFDSAVRNFINVKTATH